MRLNSPTEPPIDKKLKLKNNHLFKSPNSFLFYFALNYTYACFSQILQWVTRVKKILVWSKKTGHFVSTFVFHTRCKLQRGVYKALHSFPTKQHTVRVFSRCSSRLVCEPCQVFLLIFLLCQLRQKRVWSACVRIELPYLWLLVRLPPTYRRKKCYKRRAKEL